MQRLDGSLIEFCHGEPATFPLFVGQTGVICGKFEAFGDAGAQFGGGRLGECDGGDPAEPCPAGLDEGDDAVDEAACFAGAGAGFDDHVLVEAFEDGVASRLVGKGIHQLASSPAMAT